MRNKFIQFGRRLKGSHNPLWRSVRADVLSFVVWVVASVLGGLCRVRILGAEHLNRALRRGGVVSCWHGKTLFPVYTLQHRGILALISRSRDGEIQARVFERFGWRIVRGSSKRGGVSALRAAAREVRRGGVLGITPDGPRGPREQVQPGVAAIAALCEQGVVPAGVGCSRQCRLSTWDRYMLPRPGATAVILFRPPIQFRRHVDDPVEDLRRRVEEGMAAAEREAQRLAEELAAARKG